MIGLSGVGKTSLVQRFVRSIFSERYLSTVGVKVDRKSVEVDDTRVNLLLWDLEGKSDDQPLRTSYLNGASGMFFVVDGTRRETLDQLSELRRATSEVVGEIPALAALNKVDLNNDWAMTESDYDDLESDGWYTFLTSAKSGTGVEKAFHWLARAMVERSRNDGQ